ncbi:VOC family protein [Enterobacillus tribolii]|uniref:Catechol 2,3-dioxygenase-like lactoylglutathione lyase family enzyme n=1 Tax=Enterobacillus tribolii TaxID=1487935 RepID=A0A370R1C3_9GAMM|nr:VOC family protein [Enterobacillus tribolii]RDK95730.1 catechol 2,3-dioxygenase-like lactoylglutathione lyase family enzyme [Enterobacillus tribolii]
MTAKAQSLAYVAFQVTDLALMRQFMTDFGMYPAGACDDGDTLLMRGVGTTPVIHVSHLGEDNRFLGLALNVSSAEDLRFLSNQPGASAIEDNPLPGGGQRVRLRTPDGIEIIALHGVQPAAPLPVRSVHLFNNAAEQPRVNNSIRARAAIAPVLSLGHCVLRVSNCRESSDWFTHHFGMVISDFISTPALYPIGAFMRFDHGEALVDHHSLLINEADEIGLHHCGFEVQDLDAVYTAHEYLMEQGYELECGVGRHLLGSQIYDYWRDPFGNRVEHYTDGDRVNHHHQATHFTGSGDGTTQWGMKVPPSFFS